MPHLHRPSLFRCSGKAREPTQIFSYGDLQPQPGSVEYILRFIVLILTCSN